MLLRLTSVRRRVPALLALLALICVTPLPASDAVDDLPAFVAQHPDVDLWLTVLHNNDGESDLLNLSNQEDFGGIDRFASMTWFLRWLGRYGQGRRDVLTVTSGDNFLAGPEFTASAQKGVPFYDSIALDFIQYDAMAIGNHEFDFGPDVLADFIEGFWLHPPVFLSANLDFSQEPRLQALVDAGLIAKSTIARKGGRRIGIVGATTPNLPFISSPRNVGVNPDVAGAVQAEIDRLLDDGVTRIVLISHLQNIQEDIDLASQIRGVDIMIAGGGDEILANQGDWLVPGDEEEVFGPYPAFAPDADGRPVPLVTTAGNYGYLGRIVAGFDRNGDIIAIDPTSSPVRIAGGDQPDAIFPYPVIRKLVTDPVNAAVEALDETVIAQSEVALDGRRSDVRSTETNQGNLIADALLLTARSLAPSFGVPTPDLAFQNGGGIRNDSIIPAGPVTQLDTFNMLPFSNFVTVVPDIPVTQLKEILENAVSRVEAGSGRFAQVAGMSFSWDPSGIAQELNDDGTVAVEGSRVVEAALDNGTVLIQNGQIVAGGTVTIATIDFLAKGGDQYPYRGAPFTQLGVTYQQALENYIVDGLGGLISAADYAEGGEGRITRLE